MTYYVNADSFGAELPANWEEIAAFLNRMTDERGIAEDHDACNELWEEYWTGAIPDAPAAETACIDRNTFDMMVSDFLTDQDAEDPLVLDGSAFRDDDGNWSQSAHDSTHKGYTLRADDGGNIYIVP